MWASVLAFFNGLLDLANISISAWQRSEDRQAGRNEAVLETYEKNYQQKAKADEIDARPSVDDPGELLKRLRKPGSDP